MVADWAAEALQGAQFKGGGSHCQLTTDARYVTTIGPLPPGAEVSAGGAEMWTVKIDLFLPDSVDDIGRYAARILDALANHSARRGRLDDGGEVIVTWRDTAGDAAEPTPDAPPDFPWKATAYVGVQVPRGGGQHPE